MREVGTRLASWSLFVSLLVESQIIPFEVELVEFRFTSELCCYVASEPNDHMTLLDRFGHFCSAGDGRHRARRDEEPECSRREARAALTARRTRGRLVENQDRSAAAPTTRVRLMLFATIVK